MILAGKKHSLKGRNYRRGIDKGFALFTTLIIVIIVGIVAVSSLRLTDMTEVLAGNSIQRSRAFQAAEGGLIEGERNAALMAQRRVFSSPKASKGIFARDSVTNQWWRNEEYQGALILDDTAYRGVISPPEYIVEEIGNYVSDGGSGIVSLDRGGAGYGRRTSSGREIVLYRLQSYGVGSSTSARAVVESFYVQNQ
jgi:type IV pilus assembly protein PilX